LGFYFYSRYIHTDDVEKKVERDMHMALSCFWGSDDHYEYEKWESNLELFQLICSTAKQKCCYAQMKLVREAY